MRTALFILALDLGRKENGYVKRNTKEKETRKSEGKMSRLCQT
jgi:hypothetical protein